ncbi:HCP-like protein [Backusella circina FSU 941]|nr:HCP-like protein [Backusella circina FSU 941]
MLTEFLAEEKLFNCLIVDSIQIDYDVLIKARNGDGKALYEIGSIYYSNDNYPKARDWFILSANKTGNADAQNNLGWIYDYGQSVLIDYKQAMDWYLKAHKNGNIYAANNIGLLYEKGRGVPKNYQIAMDWYLKSANSGNQYAQYNIAYLYERGLGMPVDKQQALEWYQRSENRGYRQAHEKIRKLNEQDYHLDVKQRVQLEMEKNLENSHGIAMQAQNQCNSFKNDIHELKSQIKTLQKTNQSSEEEKRRLADQIKLMHQENQIMGQRVQLLEIELEKKSNLEKRLDSIEKMLLGKSIANEEDNPEQDFCYDG